MADVFNSHVEEDREIALDLARAIEEAGISVWYYERDAKPGLTYLEQICEAIDDIQVMIVLVSAASMGSHQVAKEIEYAHDNKKKFLPVLVDVSQADLMKRRKDWHLMFGAATSIQLGNNHAADFARIIGGLNAQMLTPNAQALEQTPESILMPQRQKPNPSQPVDNKRDTATISRDNNRKVNFVRIIGWMKAMRRPHSLRNPKPAPRPIHALHTQKQDISRQVVIGKTVAEAPPSGLIDRMRACVISRKRLFLGIAAAVIALPIGIISGIDYLGGVLASAQQKAVIDTGPSAFTAVFSPDGRQILTASITGTAIWDATRGLKKRQYGGRAGKFATYSPDGKKIIVVEFVFEADKLSFDVALFDIASGKQLAKSHNYSDEINFAAFSPDSAYFATASDDGTIRIWDAKTGTPTNVALACGKGGGNRINSVAYSHDGKKIVAAAGGGNVCIWGLSTKAGQKGISASKITDIKGRSEASYAIFSQDDLNVTTNFDGKIEVWNAIQGNLTRRIAGPDSGIFAYSPDGSLLATAEYDFTQSLWALSLWDAASGRLLTTLPRPGGELKFVAFSPDGKNIVTASESGVVRTWDVDTAIWAKRISDITGVQK